MNEVETAVPDSREMTEHRLLIPGATWHRLQNEAQRRRASMSETIEALLADRASRPPDPPPVPKHLGRPRRSIAVDGDTWAALVIEAKKRNTRAADLGADLLALVTFDRLVGAVLEDTS